MSRLLLLMVLVGISRQDMLEGESVIHSLPLSHPTYPSQAHAYAPYAPHAPAPGPYAPAHYPLVSGHARTDTVFRNPYEKHGLKELHDAIRTQDSDLAPNNPYNDPYGVNHLPHHPDAPYASVQHHPEAAAYGHHALVEPAYGHPAHLKEYKPYQYDITKIPECAYANKHYYNITFCLQDDYYPVDTIKHELERNRPLVDRLLSDITYQSADNLVDGLTKAAEEGYTYEHYYGNTKHQTYGEDYNGYTYSKEYYKDGGYICPSDIFYGRPKRAVNTYGKWKVIVNLPDEYYAKGYAIGYEKYTQTQRLEQCMYPGAPCSFIDHAYHSSCLQKHNFVRLLAYTYEEGLHIDSFKLPISCSCHVSQPRHYGYGPDYTARHHYQPQSPAYGGPTHAPPAYGPAAHHSPAYGGPTHAPAYAGGPTHAPAYAVGPTHAPAYAGGPTHAPPAYGGPTHAPPAYGGPSHGTPVPVYGSPTPSSAYTPTYGKK